MGDYLLLHASSLLSVVKVVPQIQPTLSRPDLFLCISNGHCWPRYVSDWLECDTVWLQSNIISILFMMGSIQFARTSESWWCKLEFVYSPQIKILTKPWFNPSLKSQLVKKTLTSVSLGGCIWMSQLTGACTCSRPLYVTSFPVWCSG